MIINSVIVGAGGGPAVVPVDVKASLATQSATVNDKVTLIPSNTIYASEAFSTAVNIANSNYHDKAMGSFFGGYISLDGFNIGSTFNNSGSSGYAYTRAFRSTFNSDVSGFATVSTTYDTYYDSPLNSYGFNLGARQAYNGSSRNYTGFGVISNGTLQILYSTAVNYYMQQLGPCIIIPSSTLYYNGSTMSTVSVSYPSYATKYNGEYYIVQGSSSSYNKVYKASDGSQLAGITIADRGKSYTYGITAIDDNGDYYLFNAPVINSATMDGCWVFKLNKSSSTWTEDQMSQATAVFESCFNRIGESTESITYFPRYVAQTHDFGDYCDIFVASTNWGYDYTNKGNKVAHLRFTKATETMERLADVFYDVDDITGCTSLSVNWEQGLIGIVGVYSATQNKVYVRKLDSIAEVYPYTALTSDRGNYTKDAIVGFVAENKGPDEMGSTVLSVNTTEDPTKEPFSNLNKIIGMNVIVTGGTPQ